MIDSGFRTYAPGGEDVLINGPRQFINTSMGTRSPNSRRAALPPKPKNNLPIVLGAAGGGLLLIILVVVAMSGGSGARPSPAGPGPKPPPAPKPYVPDVSGLEAEGKKKVEDALGRIKPHLSGSAGDREKMRADLDSGLKLLAEGVASYARATELAGKKYPLEEAEKTRRRAIKVLCTDLEKDGQARCDEGLKAIQSTETKMVDGAKLTDAEKKTLKADLERGLKLITEGMNLFDRSYQVSGNTFDTIAYGKARKAAAMKLGELK
jgi:hypothetical protein